MRKRTEFLQQHKLRRNLASCTAILSRFGTLARSFSGHSVRSFAMPAWRRALAIDKGLFRLPGPKNTKMFACPPY